LAILLLLTGCARTTTIPIANDVVQINTSAAPICGGNGARKVAVQMASIETINRGFDKFIVVGGGHQNNTGVVGYTPQQSYTTGSVQGNLYGNSYSAFGNSQTTTYGGQPIIAGSHDQALTIKMFRNNDPAGANAISARQQLGPEWQNIVQKGAPSTCS
jgi:hypothetical protein